MRRRDQVLVFASLILAGLLAPAAFAAPTPQAAESGAALFRDKGCAFCHGADLAGTKKAPSLAGINKDKAWSAARITNQILNGGHKMPPFRESLDDNEVSDLVSFLRARTRPAPPPAQSSASAATSPN